MPLIIIPTRIIPGCAVGASFAGAGMFSGLAGSIAFSAPNKLRLSHLLALPILVGAVWIIRYAWTRDSTLARASQLSPRLFSGICATRPWGQLPTFDSGEKLGF